MPGRDGWTSGRQLWEPIGYVALRMALGATALDFEAARVSSRFRESLFFLAEEADALLEDPARMLTALDEVARVATAVAGVSCGALHGASQDRGDPRLAHIARRLLQLRAEALGLAGAGDGFLAAASVGARVRARVVLGGRLAVLWWRRLWVTRRARRAEMRMQALVARVQAQGGADGPTRTAAWAAAEQVRRWNRQLRRLRAQRNRVLFLGESVRLACRPMRAGPSGHAVHR